ncbi:hypothetical protein [Oceanobacillus timonensis]|uniref:hypothetical protein n=1 Tax=Oceanobacillus timonensis TaxID=1926285 RepID=UPI0009B94900|nr:hypothetical protein [Oceanobacillus timonensis]
MNEKSKLNHIQSKVGLLISYFGEDNPKLKSELEDILQMVEQEQETRSELTNTLYNVISKM